MSDCCSGSGIDTAALERKQRRLLLTVTAINTATFTMMIWAATASGSSALFSGALDNFGDALTYVLSFAVVGATMAAKARVALVKGLLILSAAIGVGVQICWRLFNPEVPVFETMSIAALLNLAANSVCLALLTPYRRSDVNMSSVWECSRNDVIEGFAVIAAAGAVWAFDSFWPDLLIAAALLVMFLRSAWRVLTNAWRDLHATPRQADGDTASAQNLSNAVD